MALPGPRRRAQVAVDATGLAPAAVSPFFIRRMCHHTQQPLPWRHWLKWLAVVARKRLLILAQSARQAPWNDCANLPAWVAQAHAQIPIGCVLAPMPSSIPSATIPLFVSSFLPSALSLPSAAKGRFLAFVPKCGLIFPASNTV